MGVKQTIKEFSVVLYDVLDITYGTNNYNRHSLKLVAD